MLRPELAAFAMPTPAQPAHVPVVPSASPAGARFAGLMGQVRDEVVDYIQHGSASAAAAGGLSAEGRAWQARLASPAPITADAPVEVAAAALAGVSGDTPQSEFLAEILPHATEAARRLGVAPELVAAHAALESGWGQRPLRNPDGSDTHNLFGIKAGSRWEGATADNLTTEYEGGVALRKTERFRSYADTGAAFQDYAAMLTANPRFRAALNVGGDANAFAQGLARGGYATDPAYADKLARIAARLQSGE
ncbi:glucosaminidase domain-containing protein [Caldimonas brevitalea]|uniref:Flagellar protein FlgJ n=1 Tax=Caldimonas brevitalea TaxID=413882 RepID=A0A0G3BV15_9BURK|nr:glucosaminidase domain-containing protein [Caldimonas brevitalea]AKJ30355.1 flagellar protein FlgJ [Caldimonas brevitalea]